MSFADGNIGRMESPPPCADITFDPTDGTCLADRQTKAAAPIEKTATTEAPCKSSVSSGRAQSGADVGAVAEVYGFVSVPVTDALIAALERATSRREITGSHHRELLSVQIQLQCKRMNTRREP